ncbi:TPA: bifunctional aconitate hydratase 2/2-methylisocitrate dehydratase [Salmonella enterica subsp. salamae serovar 1,4,12,[27]:b:[e,n,x]]|uniref:bifunctional aconitate hydratase 2/2-methylisocitrate dehydratase n=1 Tax=Salmonella enterica TaxID=28901 RepID=UPI0009A9C725|nr:bifunctional aconitate hydratase 2/2-methylisocitrate dehydratase [Salmonella enterica]EBK2700693.1 bifunctional aconitate hydratase 2/2-methylisocitrate dehydratase [Salmonella enterica subsp. enterica serovar Paratyphi B]EBO9257754.1 bifunctional aconitate hydratase 2/2-methylisocitrate dehydratase [Salmonella enterica]EDV4532798.1 bifunctional aconitate hydratase 2/2-methylisocitrate dehydratase [Salmonella enterica subsp. enterica]QVP44969.1 bifunctional aconitate hydratase 2/2-methyliso
MLEEYRKHVAERAAEGIVPKPLDATQMAALVELLKNPPAGEEEFLLDLLINRVPPGVDEAAYVKAGFLAAVAKGDTTSPLVSPEKAIELLGTMQGGYNIHPLIDALDDAKLAPIAAKALSHTLLMFDNFYDVEEKAKAGNDYAKQVMQSWADAEWFLSRPPLAEKITVTVFKVTGETNTDDLSPAPDAWSRPDIPLHAQAMLKNAREGIEPDQPGVVGPIKQIEALAKKGFPLAYVGDVVGTGSSRKSATNSVLWFMGDDIPFVPNKRGGGLCLGGKIAPIFFNTMEDAGALPVEVDVSRLNMGDVIDVYPYKGEVRHHETGELLANFELKTDVLIDEVRAGGRIPLIIGRGLTTKAREALGLPHSDVFRQAKDVAESSRGFSLAQKMVGRACGVAGVRPGAYCEPKMTSVGSQDTTGPMTRDELKDLACLGFSADLVMQSFCHTAAYPKPVDVTTHHTLPDFIMNRGGVSLRPGDGVIHSWLNRMLLPDTVGTGGDSHTRFPIGISFPAGSGLVAFAAATGVMPLDMPESVLVRFKGKMQPGITLRDLVHAIPLYAIKQGLLTVEKKGKKNIFSGRILEIEGLPDLKVEQAFELTDASAERSAAGCTIKLNKEPIIEYLTSNIVLLKWMIAEGYGDRRTLERRIQGMEKWLADPQLLEADADAEYAAVIDIDLADIKEPILCAPNDPDDARLLSDVQGEKIDEVFIGSCMTNIGHFRAAGKLLDNHKGQLPTRLWVAPPTRMDAAQLTEEGYYSVFGKSGARIEIPGCSLCMGNQARVADGATVVSTSTRNFPNRLGTGANVFLASAELAAVAALIGKLPTPEEYQTFVAQVDKTAVDTYRYLNFDQLSQYTEKADGVIFQTAV